MTPQRMTLHVYPKPQWMPHRRNTWEVWCDGVRLSVIRDDEGGMLFTLRTAYPGDSIVVHREPRKLKRPKSIWR